MRSQAFVAVLISCFFMLLYIWFRFKDIRFAGSAILALVHDVLVVLAMYALLRISVGSAFIACMLTVIGYSVNATIVTFDRIRENKKALRTETPGGFEGTGQYQYHTDTFQNCLYVSDNGDHGVHAADSGSFRNSGICSSVIDRRNLRYVFFHLPGIGYVVSDAGED